MCSFGSFSSTGKRGKYPQATRAVAATAPYCCTAVGSMGEKGKLVIGFETNCVPDLNALLDDGEDRMAKHILHALSSKCLAEISYLHLCTTCGTAILPSAIIDRLVQQARSLAAPCIDHVLLIDALLEARCSLAQLFWLRSLMLFFLCCSGWTHVYSLASAGLMKRARITSTSWPYHW